MTDAGYTSTRPIRIGEIQSIFDTIYIDDYVKTKHYYHYGFFVAVTNYNFKIEYVVKNNGRELFKGVEQNKKLKETLKDIQHKLNSEYIKKKKSN